MRNDSLVQPYKLSIMFVNTDIDNNFCTDLDQYDVAHDCYQFTCIQKHVIYSVLTLGEIQTLDFIYKLIIILAFTLIPGFTTVLAIFDEYTCNILTGVSGILSLLLLIAVASSYGVLHFINPELTNNIYMGSIISFTILLLIVFCGDMHSVVGVLGLFLVTGCRAFWNEDDRTLLNFFIIRRRNISLQHFMLYPLLVAISPFLIVLIKLRVIFPSNWFVKTQKLFVGLGEAVWEASPQLTIQLYIIFKTFDQGVSELQFMVVLSSSLSLVIPAIELYLQRFGKPVKFRQILAYFPLFFVANIFRILSIAILIVFFTFPWIFITLLICGLIYTCIFSYIGYLYNFFNLTLASHEAACQGPIRLTNLGEYVLKEENDPDPNPTHRKWSFLWYLVIYSSFLSIIVIICDTNPNTFIFHIAHWDYYNWADLPLVTVENGRYFNIIIWSTIAIGFLGLLLDFFYYWCGHGVFVFQNKT